MVVKQGFISVIFLLHFEATLQKCVLIYLIYAGDGGEDVSCVLESWHLEKSDTERGGVFPANYDDSFLNNLKCFFVEALVYPRVHMGRRCKLIWINKS